MYINGNQIFLDDSNEEFVLFTPMENSTCSLHLQLSNILFDERELISKLYCEGHIVAIHCNFGHIELDGFIPPTKAKISNRGRKKNIKPKNKRKVQGDGTCFDTQITFIMVDYVKRMKPKIRDKFSDTAIPFDRKTEYILKDYHIKLFRTGTVGIPGILREDYSDVMHSINELVKYMRRVFKDNTIKITEMYPTMKNYKFRLKNNMNIDMRTLRYYCAKHFVSLYNTNFNSIFDYLCNPYSINNNSPIIKGWNKCISKSVKIDLDRMFTYVDINASSKNVFVNKIKLLERLEKININKTYELISTYINKLREYLIIFDNDLLVSIFKAYMADIFYAIEKEFKNDKDNSLSSISYDREKYPGFLIKVFTPQSDNPEKQTTIKIFPSGKINIDGSRNYDTAFYISRWLDQKMQEIDDLLYDPEVLNEDTDSEFDELSDNL